MNKSEKASLVKDLVTMYNSHQYVFMIDYKNVDAGSAYDLRKTINAKTGDKVTVVKNSLHSVALGELGLVDKVDAKILTGQIALIFTNDLLGIAYVLKNFVSKNIFKFVAYFDKNVVSHESDFISVSKYESITSLRACLVGMLANSYSGIVRLLNVKSSN